MKRGALSLPLALLLTSCEHKTTPALYAPHEEGLTLAYENPQVPVLQRRDQRLQVRISHVTPAPTGALKVEATYTTLQGEFSGTLLLEDGAVIQLSPEGRVLAELLPKGFPDQISEWNVRGRRFRMLGRARAIGLEVSLPPDFNTLGVWVESVSLDGTGARLRTFYLPNLGEVETQTFQQGQWLSINKLVARGFTDLPTRAPILSQR